MRSRFRLALALLLAACMSTAHAANVAPPPVVGAYYPGFRATEYPVAKIPADKITHLFLPRWPSSSASIRSCAR